MQPYYQTELGKLYNGNCLDVMPKLDTVDLIFTDPPYPHEYIYLYSELSKHAYKLLKTQGLLFAYAGNDYIPEVISSLSRFLTYRCMVVLQHAQSQILFSSRYNAKWKPIFVFCKGTWENLPIIDGSIPPNGRDKRYHVWGQSMYEVIKCLKKHTKENETVLDPFSGGGTTAHACEILKRKWIAIETNESHCENTAKRIENERKQLKLF